LHQKTKNIERNLKGREGMVERKILDRKMLTNRKKNTLAIATQYYSQIFLRMLI
jgi:hypothetical protein